MSWPELTADVATGRQSAQRVANRAVDDEDRRFLVLSNTIEALTARISDQETADEQRDLDAKARDAQLEERISTESEERRRANRTIDNTLVQLQNSLAASDGRTAILEREMLRLRKENNELIALLEGLFGSLASQTDVMALQQELAESGLDSTRTFQELSDEISGVRTVVDEHSETMESLVSRREMESVQEQFAHSVASTLESRYVELRDRVEEARVTAEKAADRADFASDGVSAVQVDLEEEMAALNERVRNAPSESELRAEFAAVARKQVRTQAEQLSAIRAELDRRLDDSRREVAASGRTLRRWQQWIDLDEADKTIR